MKWRTDKPTADVIVAYVWMSPAKEASNPCILRLAKKPYEHYYDDKCFEVPYGSIEKWADLEEDETVTDTERIRKEGSLEHWLEYFGMPKDNIENCITQIAQGYGACRYLEGVQRGAEAVNELAKGTPEELIQKSWYRQGYIDGINKQEPQWILENLRYKENPKYGQPLETVTDCYQLEEEIDRAIDDLEGVAEKDADGVLIAHLTLIEHLKDFARHFAKWGAEHLKKIEK